MYIENNAYGRSVKKTIIKMQFLGRKRKGYFVRIKGLFDLQRTKGNQEGLSRYYQKTLLRIGMQGFSF